MSKPARPMASGLSCSKPTSARSISMIVATFVTGKIDPVALALIKRCGATYVEETVSGTGVRVIGLGGTKYINRKQKVLGSEVSIESYRWCPRYITISGMTLAGVKPNMPDLGNIDAVITAVVAELDLSNGTAANFQHHKQGGSYRRRGRRQRRRRRQHQSVSRGLTPGRIEGPSPRWRSGRPALGPVLSCGSVAKRSRLVAGRYCRAAQHLSGRHRQ